MLPLTEDVIKISKFIAKEEQKCAEELKCDPRDISKLRHLTELLLAHVILLNRKRSGEAQRITINDYLRKEEDMAVQDIYESLTVTEKVLVQNIKRFTIREKKGRAVPVIFTKEMQRNTEVLKTDDKLQIAKVSKLLLLMENKSVGEYRGESLEEIDLDIPEFLSAKDHPSCSEKKVENISKSTKSNVNSGMEKEPVDDESDDILQLSGNSQNEGKKKAKNEKTKTQGTIWLY
ncbi:hypothetical protein JTB14_035913 [Gonioctena quinquepunctata]|nr:hypothetical protein JTB14_035913 [Gonioctena quinquepunctata]